MSVVVVISRPTRSHRRVGKQLGDSLDSDNSSDNMFQFAAYPSGRKPRRPPGRGNCALQTGTSPWTLSPQPGHTCVCVSRIGDLPGPGRVRARLNKLAASAGLVCRGRHHRGGRVAASKYAKVCLWVETQDSKPRSGRPPST